MFFFSSALAGLRNMSTPGSFLVSPAAVELTPTLEFWGLGVFMQVFLPNVFSTTALMAAFTTSSLSVVFVVNIVVVDDVKVVVVVVEVVVVVDVASLHMMNKSGVLFRG